jgi:hypothetical protein
MAERRRIERILPGGGSNAFKDFLVIGDSLGLPAYEFDIGRAPTYLKPGLPEDGSSPPARL